MNVSKERYKGMLDAYARRREQMRELRARGWTLQQIAAKYGVSRARVGQLLNVGKHAA